MRELNRKGPGRPLPPTPDDDDTIRRANAAVAQGHSPALANNRGSGLQQPGSNNTSQVMPDLLPQQSNSPQSGMTPGARMSMNDMDPRPFIHQGQTPTGMQVNILKLLANRVKIHLIAGDNTPVGPSILLHFKKHFIFF